MYLENLRTKLSQGDVLVQIPLLDSANPTAPEKTHNIIILSHTCEIDKPKNMVVLVCAIKPLTDFGSGQDEDIRRGRMINVMYLALSDRLPESGIDFRYTYRFHKEALLEFSKNDHKISSLTDEGQEALANFYYRFLVRK